VKIVLKDKKAAFIFLCPSLVLFTLIVIIPLFMSAYYSLTQWSGIGERTFVGFDNYVRLFADQLFRNASRNTLIIAIASVFIQLPISMLLALVLAKLVKKPQFFLTVYFIPVVLSAVVIGQLWIRIYNQQYGLLNLFLKGIGLVEAGSTVWLGSVTTVFPAVLAVILWQYVGYHMLLFYSGIRSISTEIFDAADIDGASFWQTSFRITIPMIKPIILISMTFAVVGSMKVYDLVRVLTTDGGPGRASDVISTLLVRTMIFPGKSYGYGSAMAMLLIAMCFFLYFLLAFLFKDRDEPIIIKRRNNLG